MVRHHKIQKRLSVSAVIINKEGKILLFKRTKDREYHPNKWNIVAGKTDSHDQSENIIGVEIYEETGLHGRVLLPPINWYVYFPEHQTYYHDNTFLATIDEGEIRLDDEHTEFAWVDPYQLDEYDIVDFLKENLHAVGLTNSDDAYKVLYTNYKGETRWRYITPKKYFFGKTEYHPTEQWLMETFDHDKQGERTYALADIHVLIPPVYKER